MAKKQSIVPLLLIGGLVLIWFVAQFFFLLIPLLILGGWLYCFKFVKISPYGYVHGVIYDFWLSPEEKTVFKDYASRFVDAEDLLEKAWQKGGGLSRNQDGAFNARSKLGKQLNAFIEEVESIVNKLQSAIEPLAALPAKRWKAYYYGSIFEKTLRTTGIIWLLALNGIALCAPGGYIINLPRMIQFPALYLDNKLTTADWHNALWILAASFIAFAVKFFAENEKMQKNFLPCPPLVTLDNIDYDLEDNPLNGPTKKFITAFLRLRAGKPRKKDGETIAAFLDEGYDVLKWIEVILSQYGEEDIKEEMDLWKQEIKKVKAILEEAQQNV